MSERFDEAKFKQKLRNFLIEHEVEPFCIVGFRNQDDFDLNHVRGDRDMRALNDLFKEIYLENFEPEEVVFEADGEWCDD